MTTPPSAGEGELRDILGHFGLGIVEMYHSTPEDRLEPDARELSNQTITAINAYIARRVLEELEKQTPYVDMLEEHIAAMYDGNPPRRFESDGWRNRIAVIKKEGSK
jgi:hypothetical protein